MEPLILRGVTREETREALDEFGEPIRVFDRFPIWKPITIDPSRPKNRNGGTGLIGLHVDFINAEFPPEYVAFWCEEEDEGGGGANIVANVWDAAADLTPPMLAYLYERRYSHGAVVDLSNVGADINPFPVFGSRFVRYGDGIGTDIAFQALHDALWNRVQVVQLHKGDALILDQRTHVHGRLPVFGTGRRLLSMYARSWSR